MLSTVDEVIEKLGGTHRAAEIAAVVPAAVSNWRKRGKIPSDRYFVIGEALRAVEAEADPLIFGFRQPEAIAGELPE